MKVNFKDYFGIAVTMCSFFIRNSNASVSLTFNPDESCILECDGIKKEFINVKELSNGINEITNQHFTVDSVVKVHTQNKDIVWFFNFQHKNLDFKLHLIGSGNKPDILRFYVGGEHPAFPSFMKQDIKVIELIPLKTVGV
ncbi:MAG: hypothetical protein IJ848_01225 [Alphaproteobacteria bacterium]|nr:hypothetical protein [Alphaproteobacteria bacterium]